MRILLLAAVPAVLFAQAGGVVEGTVTNRTTHGGIEGVDVMVQSVASQNGPDYTGTTDASGAFHIEGVPDGEYRANFGKPGFVPGDIGLMLPPAPFRVTAADGPVRLQLSLVRSPGCAGGWWIRKGIRFPMPRCNWSTRAAADGRKPRPGRTAFSNWAKYFPPRS